MLVHHLLLAVAPFEDTGAARAGLGAVGKDPVQASRHGRVAVDVDREIGNIEINLPR